MSACDHNAEIAALAGATIERVEFRNDWAVLVLADGREAVIDWRSFIVTYTSCRCASDGVFPRRAAQCPIPDHQRRYGNLA